MTTITVPSSNFGSVALGAIGGALAMLILVAVIALAAMNLGAPAAPTHDLLQNTTPIYNDTTPLSGPSMY
jgi:hypothetical protein